eukprot:4284710-Karenia_brevis.AAC.1
MGPDAPMTLTKTDVCASIELTNVTAHGNVGESLSLKNFSAFAPWGDAIRSAITESWGRIWTPPHHLLPTREDRDDR